MKHKQGLRKLSSKSNFGMCGFVSGVICVKKSLWETESGIKKQGASS